MQTKLYNDKKFTFHAPSKLKARDLDLTPNGNGGQATWDEAIVQLREPLRSS
jgi:hypothetical protein